VRAKMSHSDENMIIRIPKITITKFKKKNNKKNKREKINKIRKKRKK